jgi:hypothetical protein
MWERVGIRVGVGIGVQTSTLILFLYNVNNTAGRHINSNPHHEPNINITTNCHIKTLYLRGRGQGRRISFFLGNPHSTLLMTSALQPATILDGIKSTPITSILKLLPAKAAFCQILLLIYFLFHFSLGDKVSEICSSVFPKRPRAR